MGESVVLNLGQKLGNTHCTLYFDNSFNSPLLFRKLFDKGIYCVGTVRSSRQNMALMFSDKEMKWGDTDIQFASNIVAVKWYDSRGVTLSGTTLEGCTTTSSVLRRAKGQTKKNFVPCPQLIKEYKAVMGGRRLLR